MQVLEDTADAFVALAENEPEKCCFSLNDFTDAKASPEVLHAIKTGGARVKPYCKKIAVIGLGKKNKVFANMLLVLLGINMRVFEFKDDALNWLIERE